MKRILILLCLPLLFTTCKKEEDNTPTNNTGNNGLTYVPDTYFEQALIDLGLDETLDDYVLTSNINDRKELDLSNRGIEDLTGIEDFTALTVLECWSNQLTTLDVSNNTALTALGCDNNQLYTLDVSQNTALTDLNCADNQLISLDVSGATALTDLVCFNNQLTSLDVSQNTALTTLDCFGNNLTSLDVSNNTALIWLKCHFNQLTSLDVRNGNNMQMGFDCTNNPNLECINVDDVAWSTAFWTNTDPQHYFSNNCPPPAIEEHFTKKELLKVNDILGRETKQTNQPLFYIYDDGTVKKRIVIE